MSITMKKVPEIGDLIYVPVGSWRYPDKNRRVLGVCEYTGRYPEHYTHVVKYDAPWLNSGVGQKLIKVEP